jgi:tetratricopeptide (TPR) repeat protein
MGGERVTRRQALAAGVAAVAAGTGAGPPAPKADPSWVGTTVLPRAYAATGAVPAPAPDRPGAPPAEFPAVLDAASYEVKAEKGARVEVLLSSGAGCWVEKADLVPLADAVAHFTAALKADAKDTFALVSRGWANHLLGEPGKAVEDFTAFLGLTPAAGPPVPPGGPQRWEGLVNRGLVFAGRGEFGKAAADLDEAVRDCPGIAVGWVNRGYAFELAGKYAEALADYEQAERAGAAPLARNNRAWVLATCPAAKVRDGAKAVELARAACEATRDREGMYLDTLAAAHAEAGGFADAVRAQEKALADKGYTARYGEDGRARLALYKDKKPFRTAPVKPK